MKDGELVFCFACFYGVWTSEKGIDSYYICDGTKLGEYENIAASSITGTVSDFTRELAYEYSITVETDTVVDADALAGRMINIESKPNTNAAYMIKSAKKLADGKIRLNIGDVTTIKCYVDKFDFSKGFVYHLAEGLRFRIPLSTETEQQ